MKNISAIATLAVVIIAAVAGIAYFWLSSGASFEPSPGGEASVYDYFTEKLQEPLKQQTIQGFEPFMFIEEYPGLEAGDFDGVTAVGGVYENIRGEVVYVPGSSKVITTADFAITEGGMKTLLDNIAARLGIAAEDTESVDSIIAQISQKQ